MAAAPPVLHVIAGPNGAGKTTLYDIQIRPLTRAEFVNADRLALEHFGHVAETRAESEMGQRLAEQRRQALMASRESLVTETTFSHPSKLALLRQARAAGYRLVVYHVNVSHPDLSVARVASRVAQGGHPVPEQKIRERYERNPPLIRDAVLMADNGFVFDGGGLGEPARLVMRFTGGVMSWVGEDAPDWASRLYRGSQSA